MTKTLTEQWQEGKLKEGYYYTLLDTDSKMIEINYCWDDGCFQDYHDNMVDEVLAPVPSYNEYIALKDNCDTIHKCWNGANEKIKKIQEQLKEANKLIKDFNEMHEFNKSVIEYLKKWGVK